MRLCHYLFPAMLMVTSCVTFRTCEVEPDFSFKALNYSLAKCPDGKMAIFKAHQLPEEEYYRHMDEKMYGVVILNSAIRHWHILWDCRGGVWFRGEDKGGDGPYCLYDAPQNLRSFTERGWADGYPLTAFKREDALSGFVDTAFLFKKFPNCQFVYAGHHGIGKGIMFFRMVNHPVNFEFETMSWRLMDVIMVTDDWDALCGKMAMLEEQHFACPERTDR